jgi:uncharacterized protein
LLVVSDTSPLRALQAIGRVQLVESIYGRVLVPPAVVAELAVDAPAVGAFRVADYPFLVVQGPRDDASVARLMVELNAGEAEALALAVEIRADAVLIDETTGRRVAARLGLRTVGVLALLVQAKGKGLVERVGPLIDELDAKIRFRVSEEVRRRVLEDAGEGT